MHSIIKNNLVFCFVLIVFQIKSETDQMKHLSFTTIQKLGVSKIIFFQEINTFIHQQCIKLIKSDSKDIYNVFWTFYSSVNPEK